MAPQSATRLEIRVPGADMNPYLALSAIFALGLRGIEKKLALPGPPVGQLSLEDRKNGKVHTDWTMPKSQVLKTSVLLSTGPDACSVSGECDSAHDAT